MAGRTLIFISTREPSRLTIEMGQSTVKPPKLGIADAREVGCRNSCAVMRRADAQLLAVVLDRGLISTNTRRLFGENASSLQSV
jgi:hypothetical protein